MPLVEYVEKNKKGNQGIPKTLTYLLIYSFYYYYYYFSYTNFGLYKLTNRRLS
jgi:hypothetical protein